MQIDALIIGRGIAGMAIGEELRRMGKSYYIIDLPHQTSSSRVAGGLFNPIVFRTNKKTWLADELFPSSQLFWDDLSNDLNTKATHPLPFFKVLNSTGELNDWMSRSSEPGYQQFISSNIDQSKHDGFDVREGLGRVEQAGYVDIKTLLESHRSRQLDEGSLREEAFEDEAVIFDEDGLRYNDIRADYLIDCRGLYTTQKPKSLFSWIPVRPMKGELLTIYSEDLNLSGVLNKGFFILPQPELHTYKVGATYSPKDYSPEITKDARIELEEKLKEIIRVDYKIIDQQAGLRPASRDRKPIVGAHPRQSRAFALNGLGSKGITLAPYFANQLVKHIFDGKSLDGSVDIQRFYKFYENEKD